MLFLFINIKFIATLLSPLNF